mmetsp:Transcript_9655/g.16220  ORF Transcript_9655/g.16220 Transcript_9655/m.16220 type:complete len:201 (-) Transcript_9655:256-858(-)
MLGDHEEEEQVCDLCERAQPIFLVGYDNAIMRMQDRHLPEFLKQLKQDFVQQQEYFKILKVNSKFVQSCECPRKIVHQYCGTAQILRTKVIYCDSCKSYFKLRLQKEKLISPQTFRTLSKLALFYIAMQVTILGVGELDKRMKVDYAKQNGLNESEVTGEGEYSNIIGLSISLLIIWIWCVSLNLRNCINKNQKIIYAEI